MSAAITDAATPPPQRDLFTKLSKHELDALEELDRHQHRVSPTPYWWRKASMAKLATRGLVKRDPAHGTPKSPAWVMTPAGTEYLKGLLK